MCGEKTYLNTRDNNKVYLRWRENNEYARLLVQFIKSDWSHSVSFNLQGVDLSAINSYCLSQCCLHCAVLYYCFYAVASVHLTSGDCIWLLFLQKDFQWKSVIYTFLKMYLCLRIFFILQWEWTIYMHNWEGGGAEVDSSQTWRAC